VIEYLAAALTVLLAGVSIGARTVRRRFAVVSVWSKHGADAELR
jgi:hypothetical protein